MNNYAIIVDLDNTIIDTAERKNKIINKKLKIKTKIEDIKLDYDLISILGGKKTTAFKTFFKILSSENGILNYPASIFQNAKETIDHWLSSGMKVVIVTARPAKLKNATKKELKNLGFNNDIDIIMPDDPDFDLDKSLQFKFETIKQLQKDYSILCTIGDRSEDIEAGIKAGIPTILLESTQEKILKKNPCGHKNCKDWFEIFREIALLKQNKENIDKLRDSYIEQYAKWLSDLDNKSRINATIGIGLSALTGSILVKGNNNSTITIIIISIAFLFSILSIIFSIKSMTSRYTSGNKAGKKIKGEKTIKMFQHALYILFNIKSFKYIHKNDPVKEFDISTAKR